MEPAAALAKVTDELVTGLEALSFGPLVTHVYNPLVYARSLHDRYLAKWARKGVRAIWLGMNPGPWGMVQTGVPFGEVSVVREWLGIDGDVAQPPKVHPKRPVVGFACKRAEVSGKRLWGFAKEEFGTPDRFFERFFVWNYCPLAFFDQAGENLTPDKLKGAKELFAICDRALEGLVGVLEPSVGVGVGAFAEQRFRAVFGDRLRVGRIPHPSPASPAANKDWPGQVRRELGALGLLP